MAFTSVSHVAPVHEKWLSGMNRYLISLGKFVTKTVIIDTFEDKIMVIVTFKYYGARFSEFSCDLMKQDSCII